MKNLKICQTTTDASEKWVEKGLMGGGLVDWHAKRSTCAAKRGRATRKEWKREGKEREKDEREREERSCQSSRRFVTRREWTLFTGVGKSQVG